MNGCVYSVSIRKEKHYEKAIYSLFIILRMYIASAFSYTLTYLKATPNTYAASGTATVESIKHLLTYQVQMRIFRLKKGDRYYLSDTGWQLLEDAVPTLGKIVDEPSRMQNQSQ